jgi:hypothetical protein
MSSIKISQAPVNTSTRLTTNISRPLVGVGEMVVVHAAPVRSQGVASVGVPARKVAPMDVTQNIVKLSTNEAVSKADFANLSTEQQTFLKKYGIEAFNAEAQKEIKVAEQAQAEATRYIAGEIAKQGAWEAENLVTLSTGEKVAKAFYDTLTSDQKVQLTLLGVTKYNAAIQKANLQSQQTQAVYDASKARIDAIPGASKTVQTGIKYDASGEPSLEADVQYDISALVKANPQDVLTVFGPDTLNKVKEMQALQKMLEAKVISKDSGFIGPVSPELSGSVREEAVTAALVARGIIPKGADFVSYDASTGQIDYKLPTIEEKLAERPRVVPSNIIELVPGKSVDSAWFNSLTSKEKQTVKKGLSVVMPEVVKFEDFGTNVRLGAVGATVVPDWSKDQSLGLMYLSHNDAEKVFLQSTQGARSAYLEGMRTQKILDKNSAKSYEGLSSDEKLKVIDAWKGFVYQYYHPETAGEAFRRVVLPNIPVVSTIVTWNDSSTLERVLNVGLDAATIFGVGLLGRAGKTGATAIKAGAAGAKIETQGVLRSVIEPVVTSARGGATTATLSTAISAAQAEQMLAKMLGVVVTAGAGVAAYGAAPYAVEALRSIAESQILSPEVARRFAGIPEEFPTQIPEVMKKQETFPLGVSQVKGIETFPLTQRDVKVLVNVAPIMARYQEQFDLRTPEATDYIHAATIVREATANVGKVAMQLKEHPMTREQWETFATALKGGEQRSIEETFKVINDSASLYGLENLAEAGERLRKATDTMTAKRHALEQAAKTQVASLAPAPVAGPNISREVSAGLISAGLAGTGPVVKPYVSPEARVIAQQGVSSEVAEKAQQIVSKAISKVESVFVATTDAVILQDTLKGSIIAQLSTITEIPLRRAVGGAVIDLLKTVPEVVALSEAIEIPLNQWLEQSLISTVSDSRTVSRSASLESVEEAEQAATQVTAQQAAAEQMLTQQAVAATEAEAIAEAQVTTTKAATAVRAAEVARAAELTRVAEADTTTSTTTSAIIPLIPPFPASATKKRKAKIYPDGTVIWKQGFVWKIIPPPYDVVKPISSRVAPAGVEVLTGTPQETLTFIGGKVPFADISFDLGVTDGYIDVKDKRIIFTGYGLNTDVGERLPETTRGVSIPAVPPTYIPAAASVVSATPTQLRIESARQREALGLARVEDKRRKKCRGYVAFIVPIDEDIKIPEKLAQVRLKR